MGRSPLLWTVKLLGGAGGQEDGMGAVAWMQGLSGSDSDLVCINHLGRRGNGRYAYGCM